jgi:paraquat-inducible protein A
VVYRAMFAQLDSALAFYLAACVLFVIANSFPIASIEAAGSRVDTTLIGAARALHAQHMNLVALLVIATTIVIPGVELFCATAPQFVGRDNR